MSSQPGDERGGFAGTGAAGSEPSEEELRAAYEAELSRITCADVMLQTAVSLLNLGARRLGRGTGGQGGAEERDLGQVRDAIDGVRALLGVLERSVPRELAPLRDALSQLQLAYAQEAQSAPAPAAKEPAPGAAEAGAAGPAGQPDAPRPEQSDTGEGTKDRPGPAETSGRLWVPGR